MILLITNGVAENFMEEKMRPDFGVDFKRDNPFYNTVLLHIEKDGKIKEMIIPVSSLAKKYFDEKRQLIKESYEKELLKKNKLGIMFLSPKKVHSFGNTEEQKLKIEKEVDRRILDTYGLNINSMNNVIDLSKKILEVKAGELKEAIDKIEKDIDSVEDPSVKEYYKNLKDEFIDINFEIFKMERN